MSKELTIRNQQDDSVVVYQSKDGIVRLDVQLSDETVWLTQQQMMLLFETTKQNVSLHINNIFRDVFFFKQKTAYEFSECDWSSDVCSSDLGLPVTLVEAQTSGLPCLAAETITPEIGRASCRERVCQYV